MYRIRVILVMVIWGSLGVFTRWIPLSALNLAFLRALIALPVLLLVMQLDNKKAQCLSLNWSRIKPYIISGVLLGIGWLTLFYGFKHTNIASAVIIYNMCPVYVLIAAPVVLGEKTTKVQGAVIMLSFVGLMLIVGENLTEGVGYIGMALSALSGIMYAMIVLINRRIKERLNNNVATLIQVLTAMMVLLPFVIADGSIREVTELDSVSIVLIIIIGMLHTGIVYSMFFSVYAHMKSVEIVSFSYLEPMFAIVFGFFFAGEALSVYQLLGGALILGSTFLGERLNTKLSESATSST